MRCLCTLLHKQVWSWLKPQRTKKIRCDILTPPDEDAPPICAHCKQHDLGCTFYMPITETRFKKRKQTGESRFSDSSSLGSLGRGNAGHSEH
jgi:hypothetical protein